MITNDKKQLFASRKAENAPKTFQQQPMLNLQMYQPRPPPKPKPPTQNTFQPYFNPNPMFMTPYGAGMGMPFGYNTVQPIVKEVNLNLNHLEVNDGIRDKLFEDAMPVKKTFGERDESLGERVTKHEFIRSMLFAKGDASDISAGASGGYSFLNRMKFMDLNPYNTNRLSNNPYKGLPRGFLLYRSCYPIRQNDRFKSEVMCARDSTGVNVRVYRMNEGEYHVKRLNNGKNLTDYDVWREQIFYEYIRDHILKKNICPNFPMMIGYHLPQVSGINFDKDNKAARKRVMPKKTNETMIGMTEGLLSTATGLPVKIGQTRIHVGQNPDQPRDFSKVMDVNEYTGKAMIIMTEASNYNLFNWASTIYTKVGSTNTMVNTGYHRSEEWFSVLFQIMAALYTMQLHGICIKDFRMDRNVFIKDLRLSGKAINHWKYIVNGVEYYVPNHGYTVRIDSNFRDRLVQHQEPLVNGRKVANKVYVLSGSNPVPVDSNLRRPNAQHGGNDGNIYGRMSGTIDINQPPTPRMISHRPQTLAPNGVPGRPGRSGISATAAMQVVPTANMSPDMSENEGKLIGKIFNDNISDQDIQSKTFEAFKRNFNNNMFSNDFSEQGGCNLPEDVKIFLDAVTSDNSSEDIGDYFHTHMNMFVNNRVGTYLKDSEKDNKRENNGSMFKEGEIAAYNSGYGAHTFCIYVNDLGNGRCQILTRNDPNGTTIETKQVNVTELEKYIQIEPVAQNFDPNGANLTNLIETYIVSRESKTHNVQTTVPTHVPPVVSTGVPSMPPVASTGVPILGTTPP